MNFSLAEKNKIINTNKTREKIGALGHGVCILILILQAISYLQVSKVLHAAEGQEKQARQHAEVLKSAAYAAQSLAGDILSVCLSP